MKPTKEIQHLLTGPASNDKVEGAGIILLNVYCQDNAHKVLQNCREVLEIILRQYDNPWPSETEWYNLLPKWFVERCASEKTIEEEEEYLAKWRTLSRQEQIIEEEEKAWSVMEWIGWFEPDDELNNQRYWFWWDAFVKSSKLLLVAVEVVDVPFPAGSLDWLMRASGAIKIEEANYNNCF
jgi:hypothetical protein